MLDLMTRSNTYTKATRSAALLAGMRKNWQVKVIVAFMVVAGGHFAEHLIQIFEYLVLGWPAKQSGGILGLWFPGLAASEYLHSGWNTLQLTGLILLWPLFRRKGKASLFWKLAMVAQSWHWLEHVLLQVQYLTGYYLFHAIKQQSILELFFPRIELHFVYNLLSFMPTLIAVLLYMYMELKKANR